MVLESSANLKQFWKGLRHLYRPLKLLRRFLMAFRGLTFKVVVEASDNLKQL